MAAFYLTLAAWVFALIATDRSLLSQYIYWFNPLLVLGAGFFLLVRWILNRSIGVKGAGRWPSILLVAAVALLLSRELGIARWVAHFGAATSPKGRSIRIVHWNSALLDAPKRIDIGENLAAEGTPDIAFISMQNNPRLWEQVSTAMKGAGGYTVTLLNTGPEKVFSRFPVTATERFRVRFSGKDAPAIPAAPPFLRRTLAGIFRLLNLHSRSPDDLEDATVVAFTFDTTTTIGRTTTAWFIDMPSNPLASRADLVRHVTDRTKELQKNGSLPAPDFIVGDFNIPLGSYSLGAYAPGFSPASNSAGLGHLASWPRPRPMLQIDHLLMSPGWRAAEYRVLDIGVSEHFAQTAVIWPIETSPATATPK